MNSPKVTIYVLSSVPFMMVLGNSMLIPEFPALRSALNLNQLQVGLLITFFSAAAAVTIPFLGYFADTLGRKNILLPGIILYGLGGAAAGFASILMKDPYGVILAGRTIQGIGAAGTAPIAMTLAGDLFSARERSEPMGILEAANGIGKVLSPVIGSAVALVAWQALFFSYALLSLPIAVLIWLFVQEPGRQQSGKINGLKNYLSDMGAIFDRKGISLLINFLGGAVVLLNLFGVLSFTSDILVNRFNVGGLGKGAILSIPLLTMSTTAYLTGYYLRKTGKHYRLAFFAGLTVMGITLGVLPLCCHSLLIYPVMLGLMGTGGGLVLPAINTMVTSATGKTQRGGITSLYNSLRFTGVALGPPVFSLLLETAGLFFMFLSGGALALGAATAGLLLIKEKTIMGQ